MWYLIICFLGILVGNIITRWMSIHKRSGTIIVTQDEDGLYFTLNIENTSTSITVSKNNKHKLLAIDKLMNIARYYNKDWKPNPYSEEGIYYIRFNHLKNVFWVDFTYDVDTNDIFFKNLEDARAVANNPNFKEILDIIYR